MRRTVLLLVAAAVACAKTAPAPRQSEAMERSARMLKRLEALEADLHSGDAEVATYSELVRRHTRTEQLACKVTDDHVAEISRLQAVQEARMARKLKDRVVKKRKVVALVHSRAATRRAVASN
jgi:hypothetical protein